MRGVMRQYLKCPKLYRRDSKCHFSFLLFFFLWMGILQGQSKITKETIDKKFETAREYSNTSNPEKALSLLHEIEAESKSIDYFSGISKVGYMLSIIHFNRSDYNKVINLEDSYLDYGYKVNDYENIAHIHRIKAGAYSELGLVSKARGEYDLALKNARQILSHSHKQNALSLIYSNLANLHIKAGAPQDSIFYNLKKGISEAEKIPETEVSTTTIKYSIIAYSYIMLANEYDKIGNENLAETYYLKAHQIHNSHSVPLVEKVVLLNQLAHFYHDQKKYKISVQYAENALALEKQGSVPQLRKEIFEVLSKSYMELDESEKSKTYLKKFTALNDSIVFSNKQAVDAALNKTITKEQELSHINTTKEWIIYSLIALLFTIFALSFYFYSKKQKQIKKVEKILADLHSKTSTNEKLNKISLDEVKPEEKEEKNPIMPLEAEEKLLEKLTEFETKQLFLERKVSLPFVAAEIETNTKYISYIIKKHKEKDFNEYINDLRINYIVQKLTDDPIYRQYKINTLAEESGFSSHSKFTTVFKATLGVSPSEFIRYLKQNRG
jgi:AraC-like DNA-binding protein